MYILKNSGLEFAQTGKYEYIVYNSDTKTKVTLKATPEVALRQAREDYMS